MAFNPLNRKLDKNGNPIVSKAELEEFKSKYGQNMELRDFLNKERGLTRRGSAGTKASAPVSEERASAVEGPATATAKEVAGLRSPAASPSDSSREVTAKELADKIAPAKELADKPATSRMRAASTSDTSDFMPGSFKKGGSVSSASKRADGCAVKGKTKGRFV
jgi:hypothetical protein